MEARCVQVLYILPVLILSIGGFYMMLSEEAKVTLITTVASWSDSDDNLNNPQIIDNAEFHRSCTAHKHVFYVKVPKTGGSTMSNILHRIIAKYNLVLSLGYGTTSKDFPIYDMHTVHRQYDEQAVIDYFPNDTKIITLIRHPYSMMKSGIYFFTNMSLDGFNERSLLKNTEFTKYFYTKGKVTNYLGINTDKAIVNSEYFQRELENINKKFELVVINERYDEGLVLLKRKMCWDMKDILYLTLKPQTYPESYKLLDNSDYLKSKHKESSIDYKLYEYFSNVFDKEISNEDSFQDEVDYFQQAKLKVNGFCDEILSALIFLKNQRKMKIYSQRQITIKASSFNQKFKVKGSDCVLMSTMLGCFTQMIKTKMFENLTPPIQLPSSQFSKTNSKNFIALNLPYESFSSCNEAGISTVKYTKKQKR